MFLTNIQLKIIKRLKYHYFTLYVTSVFEICKECSVLSFYFLYGTLVIKFGLKKQLLL